jgi:hypothetical protein
MRSRLTILVLAFLFSFTLGDVKAQSPGCPGWSATAWSAGGSAVVTNGLLVIDGAVAGTDAAYGPGRSVEFEATFSGDTWQHAGFAVEFNSTPWIIFSTFEGGQLYARTRSEAGELVDTPISGNWFGTSHRYRIDWNAANVVFSIDGTIVATHTVAIGSNLHALVSDFTVGGGVLTVAP